MPPPYARASQLAGLRVDLLAREAAIQKGYAYPYDDDVREALRLAAIQRTGLLAEELNAPLVPELATRTFNSDGMDRDLPLPGRLVHIDELLWHSSGLATLDEDNFVAGDDVCRRHGKKRGVASVRGVWGVLAAQGPVVVGTYVATSAETVAGGSVPGWGVAGCSGGEVFAYLTDDACYAMCIGADKLIDAWWAPEVAIPSDSEVLYCGKLSPAIERYVLLGAYFRTWQATTPNPEPDLLTSETAGKHSYQADRSVIGHSAAVYQLEMAELRSRIWTAFAPTRTKIGQR